MLEAVELPARVSDLDTGLADVDRDALPHGADGRVERRRWEMGEGGEDLSRGERRCEDACPCGARLGFPFRPLGSFYRTGRQPGSAGGGRRWMAFCA